MITVLFDYNDFNEIKYTVYLIMFIFIEFKSINLSIIDLYRSLSLTFKNLHGKLQIIQHNCKCSMDNAILYISVCICMC